MRIAIVTGASSGIGREFAERLALREDLDEVWIISRRLEILEEMKNSINQKFVPIALDLSEKRDAENYKYMLSSKNPEVAVLVNAAGYGKFGAVENVGLEEQCGMIRLNAEGLTRVTYYTIPFMDDGGEIYQVASVSGFFPIPYISVYAATKAYALSFSRSLNVELKNRNVRSMAVCPGWVRTDFFDRAVEDEGVIVYYNKFVTAEQVVRKAFRDMKKKKDVSIPALSTRMLVRASKLLPHRLVMKIWCKQQKK